METSVLEQSFGKKLDKQMFENYNTDINKTNVRLWFTEDDIMRSKRRVIGIIIAVVFVFLMSAFFSSNSLIEAQGTKDKQFTSIQVQKGDTLWKIAKKYMGNEYSSVDDYIEEVCQTNHIYDGKITEDMYLVIPYYK